MEDVPGLADHSNRLASCMTISRKYGYVISIFLIKIYIYIIINIISIFSYLYYCTRKRNLEKIILQINIFIIFQASAPFKTIAKILQANAVRTTSNYLPLRSLWIDNLFIESVNRHESIFFTIDCSGVNINGPHRFRTKIQKPYEQVFYFNTQNDDQLFNVFVSKKKKKHEKIQLPVFIFKLKDLEVRLIVKRLTQKFN